MNNRRKLSRFLKQKRLETGLTQYEVALKLGYSSAQFISNWERGLANPPAFVLKDLGRLYKISADQLLEMLLDEINENVRREFNSARRGARR